MSVESFERRGLLLKLEVTEGTDSVPVVGTDALQILNGKSGLQSNQIERAIDRPYFGADPFVSTMFRGFIEGEVELIGAAAAGTASPLSTLLQICGFAEVLDPTGPPASAAYNPISTAIKSATAYFYHAGTLKKIVGARATLTGISMEIGKFPMAQIRIEGACGDITEQALPSGFVYSQFQAPIAVDPTTFTVSIAGADVEGVALMLDLGTELQTKQHSEGQVSRIVDRKPTGSLRCYRPLQSLADVHDKWKTGATVALVGEVNGGTNKLTRTTIAQAQIESVEEIDLERDYGFDIKYRALASSAGNDECLLEFE